MVQQIETKFFIAHANNGCDVIRNVLNVTVPRYTADILPYYEGAHIILYSSECINGFNQDYLFLLFKSYTCHIRGVAHRHATESEKGCREKKCARKKRSEKKLKLL